MPRTTIGIRVADGRYSPIFDVDTAGSRRAILTTAQDDQEKVCIGLYKRDEDSTDNPTPIGQITIDNLFQEVGKKSEFELIVNLDETGNIDATAKDLQTGLAYEMEVSSDPSTRWSDLNWSGGDYGRSEDFGYGEESVGGRTASTDTTNSGMGGSIDSTTPRRESSSRRGVGIAVAILGTVVAVAAILLVLARQFPDRFEQIRESLVFWQAEAPEQQQPKVVAEPEQEPEVPLEQELETPLEPEPEMVPESVVSEPNAELQGLWYRIQPGDTLWDLSYSFYLDPSFYGRIAKDNDITDPDLIYYGADLFILSP